MKQVRFFPNDLCGLQVREDENGQQSREVNGRAIVFGVRSQNDAHGFQPPEGRPSLSATSAE